MDHQVCVLLADDRPVQLLCPVQEDAQHRANEVHEYIMSVSERWASLRSDKVQEGREEEDNTPATAFTGAAYATKGYRTPKLDPQ